MIPSQVSQYVILPWYRDTTIRSGNELLQTAPYRLVLLLVHTPLQIVNFFCPSFFVNGGHYVLCPAHLMLLLIG